MSNMAYTKETSSVKTIVPGAEVSGFCDVVARQKINEVSSEVPQLSAGEGIGISIVDGKTVITNNISAGQNISLVYDMETNTYRIDSTETPSNLFELSAGNGISLYDDVKNKITRIDVTGVDLSDYYKKTETSSKAELNTKFNNIYNKTDTSSKQEISAALQYVSANAGKTYTGVAPIQVDNVNDQISITGESISAGPGIDMFSSGGYVVISANGGNSFPITGTNGTTGLTANMDCSSMMLTTGSGPAGGYVKQTVRGVQYEAYPSTDVSASWYNIINGANNRSNCYCIRFTNDLTSVSLENYSAYDKVTVVHSNQYTPNCELHWNGYTKVFPSGLYCEMVKGTNDQNQTDWFFTNSGMINNLEWN